MTGRDPAGTGDVDEAGPGLEETGRRALGGAGLLIARGALILGVGLGANIALARMLAPRDFGLVALGSVLVVFGTFLADTGLGASLLRREEPPTQLELAALNGLQLALTVALTLLVAIGALLFGQDALVIAIMVASLPILMLKVPSVILLERRLEYGAIARVDVAEALAFYAWALVAVALGAGVWGFASASIARAVAGAITMLRLGPVGLLRPAWSPAAVRPLIRFGAKFQGVLVISLVRDQALNVAIAVIAGVGALGVWNLAWRVLQIPLMVFGNMGRIGFPAMARLLRAGEDARPVIERGGAAVAVLAGLVMVALVAFAPALPVVLGDGWDDVPAILLWAGLALIMSFPMAVIAGPYLFAADAADVVLRTQAVAAVAWLAVALALLPSLGPPAAAIGWVAAVLVNFPVLSRATAVRSGASVFSGLAVPMASGLVAATAGWLLAREAGSTVPAGILGVVAGEALLLGALLLFRGRAVSDTWGFVRMAIGNFSPGTAAPVTPADPAPGR